MRLGLFARRSRDREAARAAADRVKAMVRACPEPTIGCATELTVSEIVCLDPACPGTETVILVMAPKRPTRALKIAKPMAAVTEQDVRAALVGLDGEGAG